MKNFKRAFRRHKKNVKHIARLKKYASGFDGIRLKDGEYIYHPNWKDLQKLTSWSNKLKTMSTICSCEMCSGNRYKRIDQKKLDRMFLKLGMEE
jgi:hypothetical protein